MLNKVLASTTEVNQNRLFALAFLGLCVILLTLVLLFFLPVAEIILTINREPYNNELLVKIDQSIKKPIDQLDALPAIFLNPQDLDQNKYFFNDQLISPDHSKILTFRLDDLNRLLVNKLESLSPAPKKLLTTPKVVDIKIDSLDFEHGQANLHLFLEAEVMPAYNLKTINNFLINRPVDEAKVYLKALSGVEGVKINMRPNGARLPSLGTRIRIKLDII
ncbi:MAG: hypothetical protein NTY61_02395 [Candidatus Parcubacteria bacterium]|nr:hypothetical protein [Candidatus Parcubacteria bacterium]